jgi:phosphoribosyl 1,2-cyclic phosphate phosphodiesterase
LEIFVLGSGTSHGVPMIGCDCPVCSSTNPRNRRSRPSILLRTGPHNILVDASADFREQMLRYRPPTIDAILFTHAHADHIFGLDDVRVYSDRQGHIPCYAAPDAARVIRQTFEYVFTSPDFGGGLPRIRLNEINGPFSLCGQSVVPVPIRHGPWEVLGFRFGDMAYLTDCSYIPESSMDLLRGLDVLILDALRPQPHPTHFSLSESIEVAQRLAPRRTFFTHICHRLDHDDTNASLPRGMELAYDGLVIRPGG